MNEADAQALGYHEMLSNLRGRLQRLHRHAGDPGTRIIAQRASRKISHSTAAEVLKCVKAPTWASLECVVKALNGDIAEFHALWIELRNAQSGGGLERDDDLRPVELQRACVDLARRSQVFTDDLLKSIDAMANGRVDSREKEIDVLYRLAARMARNSESLLLIGGQRAITPTRGEPVAIGELIRQARSRTELPGRIDSSGLDATLRVAPHATSDVVHLLAELLDNATRYSPPDSMVTVTGVLQGEAAHLRIEDTGIRLPPDLVERLNLQLRSPESIDAAVPRMLGMAVVARLAARHGISVEIRNTEGNGTAVTVGLPRSVLVPSTHPERAVWARMSAGEARQILERIDDKEYKKWVMAGLAAERAEAVLNSTRSPGWPNVVIVPAADRPGLPTSSMPS